MTMQQAAQAIAHYGPFADLSTHNNGATPG
jgi:hypothetical protein